MNKITRITTQKKRKNRYNIFLDDDGHGEKFGFSIDEDLLVQFSLRRGLELSTSMLDTLMEQDTIHKSYTQVINYLSYRMRTKKEIRDYLLKKEVDNEHITQIIKKLIDKKLIDDQQFATMFVRSRIQTSTKGPTLVKKELIDKGVSSMFASRAIEQYTYDIQHEKASKLVKKKFKQNNKHSFRKNLQQLQATLMRNGFSQEVIKDVVSNLHTEKRDDAEWGAIVHHGEKLLRKHQGKLTGYELRNKLKGTLYRQGFTVELIDQFLEKKIDPM